MRTENAKNGQTKMAKITIGNKCAIPVCASKSFGFLVFCRRFQFVSKPKVTITAAHNPGQILAGMVGIVRRCASDVAEWALDPLEVFFRRVARGHYDREPTEWKAQILARPALVLSRRVPVVACANKAILMASWAQLNRMPWRFVAVGRIPGFPPHHVYTELFIGGAWRSADATYPWGVLFLEKSYPVRVVAVGLEANQ